MLAVCSRLYEHLASCHFLYHISSLRQFHSTIFTAHRQMCCCLVAFCVTYFLWQDVVMMMRMMVDGGGISWVGWMDDDDVILFSLSQIYTNLFSSFFFVM